MRRVTALSVAIIAAANGGRAFGAQDHSAHQDHAMHEPPAEHRQQQDKTESESRHVPPALPQLTVTHTSNEAMIELMEMDDTAAFGKVLLDQVEWSDESELKWDAQAWYGGDYNKLWLKTEGHLADGEQEGDVELLWDRVVSRWWNIQAGVRHDFGEGSARTWAAFGVQGLAPYWCEVEATVYVGDEGRSAARFVGEYELLLTQRWVLQPKLEANLYGKEDARNRIGSGLSDLELGLRLRYEIRREFAPYAGVVWSRSFGGTADFLHDGGEEVREVRFVAGVRAWF